MNSLAQSQSDLIFQQQPRQCVGVEGDWEMQLATSGKWVPILVYLVGLSSAGHPLRLWPWPKLSTTTQVISRLRMHRLNNTTAQAPNVEVGLRQILAMESTASAVNYLTIMYQQDRTQSSPVMLKLRRKDSDGTVDKLISQVRLALLMAYPRLPVRRFDSPSALFDAELARLNGVPQQPPFDNDICLRLAISPVARLSLITQHFDGFTPDAALGPCGSYSRAYMTTCDALGLEPSEEVVYLVDHIWHPRSHKSFDVDAFGELDTKLLVPVLSALEFNEWFDALVLRDVKMLAEVVHLVLNTVARNKNLVELVLVNTAMPRDFPLLLADILNHLPSTANLTSLDLSRNLMEDRVISPLAQAIRRLPRGLTSLRLSTCNISKKAMPTLLSALRKTTATTTTTIPDSPSPPMIPLTDTLMTLDLSGNTIGPDGVLALC